MAIPITLLITFGMSPALGIDLQQVSIATLIIVLGLLALRGGPMWEKTLRWGE